ncbi:MAG: hypothetical protein OHK0038_25420 [Flammeovirgaceae bacterium]
MFLGMVSAQDLTTVERDANGFYWGDKPGENKLKYTDFSDNHKFGEYKNAIPPLEWLLANSPLLHENIYIKGVKVYQELAAKETDETLKRQYQDKALSLYDLRIKYFGKEAVNLSYKATLAYEYWIQREQYDSLFALFSKVVELNGNDTWSGHLSRYMGLAVILKKKSILKDEDVMKVYDKISKIITFNLEKNKESGQTKEWEDVAEKINGMLAKAVALDCATIQKTLGKTVMENSEDIQTSKRAILLMLNSKCTDSPLFLQANLNVFAKEPDAGRAKAIAKLYLAEKNYNKAIEYLEKGLQVANIESDKKAEILLDLGKIYYAQGKKEKARSYAFKAIEASPTVNKEAYSLVGDIYYASGEDCYDASNPLKARTVYLAAYDMYEKAGNQQGMERAKEQFPSIQDVFLANSKEGDAIEVGCWVGGKTIIRTRKSGNQ